MALAGEGGNDGFLLGGVAGTQYTTPKAGIAEQNRCQRLAMHVNYSLKRVCWFLGQLISVQNDRISIELIEFVTIYGAFQ